MKQFGYSNYSGLYLWAFKRKIKYANGSFSHYGRNRFELYFGKEQFFLTIGSYQLQYRLLRCGSFKGFYRATNKFDIHGKIIYK